MPNVDITTVLGFDYGTKKIGVAIGQTITGNASPLTRLPARDGIPNWDDIEKIINEWQPQLFIVGLPLNMDGTESDMSVRARKFANRLTGRFNRPHTIVDERLSSFEAKSFLDRDFAEQGTVKQKNKKTKRNAQTDLDATAAALIVESWLNNRETHAGT